MFENTISEEERKQWEDLDLDEYFASLIKQSNYFTKDGTNRTLPLRQKSAGFRSGLTMLLHEKRGVYGFNQIDGSDAFFVRFDFLFAFLI